MDLWPRRPRAAGPRVLDFRIGPDYPPFRDGKSCFRVRDRRFRAERKKEIPINKPPSQHFSRLRMSSEYVARRIVDLARHPRRKICPIMSNRAYSCLMGKPRSYGENWRGRRDSNSRPAAYGVHRSPDLSIRILFTERRAIAKASGHKQRGTDARAARRYTILIREATSKKNSFDQSAKDAVSFTKGSTSRRIWSMLTMSILLVSRTRNSVAVKAVAPSQCPV
jgi:hypothetical protein